MARGKDKHLPEQKGTVWLVTLVSTLTERSPYLRWHSTRAGQSRAFPLTTSSLSLKAKLQDELKTFISQI